METVEEDKGGTRKIAIMACSSRIQLAGYDAARGNGERVQASGREKKIEFLKQNRKRCEGGANVLSACEHLRNDNH